MLTLYILKDKIKSIVSGAVYIPFDTNIAQIVIILCRDPERHLDHNHILSQQSALVQDEHIRMYMRVPLCPKSGNPVVIIVSDWHPIMDRDNPV